MRCGLLVKWASGLWCVELRRPVWQYAHPPNDRSSNRASVFLFSDVKGAQRLRRGIIRSDITNLFWSCPFSAALFLKSIGAPGTTTSGRPADFSPRKCGVDLHERFCRSKRFFCCLNTRKLAIQILKLFVFGRFLPSKCGAI